MFRRIRRNLKRRYYLVTYNLSWHHLEPIVNTRFTQASFSIPIVGYLLLFNDTVVGYLNFNLITGGVVSYFLESGQRLRYIYFGLCLMAVAYAWYILRRPKILNLATSPISFVEAGMHAFTVYEIVQIFGSVDSRHGGPVTSLWDFDHTDLEKFVNDAIEGDDVESYLRSIKKRSKRSSATTSRGAAIDKHSEFIRSLLHEHFAQKTRTRRVELTLLGVVSGFAYLLLAIPSLDMFFSIVRGTIFQITDTRCC